ncbi:Response regulator with CheY-like receiver domain and winged-helix DNA-binding domain [Verrucomicrobia bacterium]|nr:Response regulator with CheY-like receiver domain and winged-helix DNA-binding domain [Verrucomicrobiota bacterium]
MSTPAILYVEDDPNDVFLLTRAFRKALLLAPVQHVANGQEALNYLSGAGPYADRRRFPCPALLLLDLKVPLLDGFQVLSWARAQQQWKRLPVFVLSSSNHSADMEQALQLGANRYFVKTPTFGDVAASVKALLEKGSKENGK